MWIPLLSADRASIDQIEDSPSTASTVVKILAHMYGPAAGWGIVPQGGSPCRSVAEHRSVVNRHIVPALGRLPLAAVKRRYVMELHESLCTTPEIANIAVDVLTHMFALAKGWGIVAVDCNACQFIPMNPKHMREQFLTDAEFTRGARCWTRFRARAVGCRPARWRPSACSCTPDAAAKKDSHPALGACLSIHCEARSTHVTNTPPILPFYAAAEKTPQFYCMGGSRTVPNPIHQKPLSTEATKNQSCLSGYHPHPLYVVCTHFPE